MHLIFFWFTLFKKKWIKYKIILQIEIIVNLLFFIFIRLEAFDQNVQIGQFVNGRNKEILHAYARLFDENDSKQIYQGGAGYLVS